MVLANTILCEKQAKLSGEIEIDESYFGARRVRGKRGRGASGRNHINGIENFWGYCKSRISKFRGIRKENFILHLKECEFWYYTKITNGNLYQILLKLIRENQRSDGE